MKLNVFTICLNGMPWIEHVANSFLHDPIWKDCEWTVVHGVADPVADTAWCKHIETPRGDGTLTFLFQAQLHGVKLIQRERWPGKTAMVNAALATFTEPGILVQMDADEVWTPAQLRMLPSLFARYPSGPLGAFFMCRYWVGPNRYVCQPGTFGNHTGYEWIRAWRFEPGMTFASHEPPFLRGVYRCIAHPVTSELGLVFDHYAYATRQQVEFKQAYYGPEYDPAAWDRLQAMRGPVDLLGVLPWVKESVISHEA